MFQSIISCCKRKSPVSPHQCNVGVPNNPTYYLKQGKLALTRVFFSLPTCTTYRKSVKKYTFLQLESESFKSSSKKWRVHKLQCTLHRGTVACMTCLCFIAFHQYFPKTPQLFFSIFWCSGGRNCSLPKIT